MRTIYQFLTSFLLQLFVTTCVAQNIQTTIGSFNSSSCAVGDTITLPVNVNMVSGISTSAISMAIDYDTTKLRCISAVTNLNSNISAGFLSNCGFFLNQNPNPPFTASSRRQFRATWFNLSPVAFNGLMFNLRFVVVATGNSLLKWDVSNPGNCEYSDEFADVIPNCDFVDGSVTCGTAAPTNCGITLSSSTGTTSQSVCQGSSITNITYATVSATGATVTGLPAGVTGVWASNEVMISGIPTATGTFNYIVAITGCTGGTSTASGNVTVTSNNSITLSSASVTNAQSITAGTAITTITYSTTGATGAIISGLPAGVTGTWASNTVTISGTPTSAGTYNYTVAMTGGCTGGTNTATGFIHVNAPAGPNIATTIGAVSGCIGDTVSVPVTINMASGISTAAISMAIGYDPTKLQCLSTVTSLNSNIATGFLSNCGVFSGASQFRAAWFNLTPVAFNGLMFNIRFKILAAGTYTLDWDLATPGNCEYVDELADVIPSTTWNNGAVLLSNGCFGPPQSSLCLPSITTDAVSAVGLDSALIGGNITSDGGSPIVLRGVCYSTSPNPNMGNLRTEDGTGIGLFNTVLRGLTSSTTYYARSYAKNSNGVVAYGNEVNFSTTAIPIFTCGTSTVSDVDNNMYNTIQIGTQCWTQSNLKVSKYRNGDNILTGLTNTSWETTTYGAYAIYNNDPVNDGLYGKLYNHYAVTDSRGLCPTGWHIPSHAEWTTLENHLGGSSVVGALKSTAMQPTPGGWNPPNMGATNSSGFTGLPGGLRDYLGDFFYVSDFGFWWSSSVSSGSDAWHRFLYFSDYRFINRQFLDLRNNGFSVRCVKDNFTGGGSASLPTVTTTSATVITSTGAITGGNITADGGASVTSRGVAYGTARHPTTANNTTNDGMGMGAFTSMITGLTASTRYYVRAYATNRVGTAYGNQVTFFTSSLPSVRCPGTPTVTDIDGNIYNTVQIGNQCWTQSNLKVNKYRNGDSISTGLTNTAWQNTTSGAYAIYNNNPVNDALYGKLYNHYAVTDNRGLCPTGWHVPSDGEWNILVKYLDPNADTVCGGCWQSSIAGGALKNTAMQPTPGGWASPNTGVTNSSGFTALPGGRRDNSGSFSFMSSIGYWWSSSVSSGSFDWHRSLYSDYSSIIRDNYLRVSGFSVRCLKNTLPQVNTTSVTNGTPSNALVFGEVSSDGGDQNTTRGFCYSTTSNPTISNGTTMNGTGTGVYEGILHNLNPSITYYVRAYATNNMGTTYGSELSFTTDSLPGFRCSGTPTVTDIDGNIYNTVQIGTQCWTQSNLRVSKYRNGDNIPTGLINSAWQNTTSGAYAIYNNDPVNDGLYGKLYNHFAVTDSRGLCPTGWHVPSDAEWTTLENHLGGSSVAGGELKSAAIQPVPSGWNHPNLWATNSSGFTALPGGFRNDIGNFFYLTAYGWWWSSSFLSMSNACIRTLRYNSGFINRNYYVVTRTFGFSVRCLRD